MSSRRLQEMSSRRLQDVFETCLQDVFKSNKCLLGYNNLLGTNEVNYKRHLKQLLLENGPGVQFVRLPARNQSEQVCSSHSKSNDVYQSIFQAAIRTSKEIKHQAKWKFEGNFGGFSITKSLQLLLGWIIGGPRMSPNISPDNEIDKCVEILLELMMNMIKSDRQISYATKKRGDR